LNILDALKLYTKMQYRPQILKFRVVERYTNCWQQQKNARGKKLAEFHETVVKLALLCQYFCQNSTRSEVDKNFAKFRQTFVNLLLLHFVVKKF